MTEINPTTLANRFRAYRGANALTQRGLARLASVSPGRIGEMERGIVRSKRAARAVIAVMENHNAD